MWRRPDLMAETPCRTGAADQPRALRTGRSRVVKIRPQPCSSTVLGQGCGLIFTTRDRPVRSARGWSAAPVRHGVSLVRSGRRHALGLVFHDA